MHKGIMVVIGLFAFATTFAVAAPAKKSAGKIKNTKIVQATQDLKLSYLGTSISVPKGQVILLGERPNGSIVIRGLNMDQIKVGPGTFSTEGYSVVSYQPKTNVVYLNRGKWLTLRDPQGETATVYEKGAILATNAKINSNTLEDLRLAGINDAEEASSDLGNGSSAKDNNEGKNTAEARDTDNEGNANRNMLPPLMNPVSILDGVAHQQASNDVEATLSPSAPSEASSSTDNNSATTNTPTAG